MTRNPFGRSRSAGSLRRGMRSSRWRPPRRRSRPWPHTNLVWSSPTCTWANTTDCGWPGTFARRFRIRRSSSFRGTRLRAPCWPGQASAPSTTSPSPSPSRSSPRPSIGAPPASRSGSFWARSGPPRPRTPSCRCGPTTTATTPGSSGPTGCPVPSRSHASWPTCTGGASGFRRTCRGRLKPAPTECPSTSVPATVLRWRRPPSAGQPQPRGPASSAAHRPAGAGSA